MNLGAPPGPGGFLAGSENFSTVTTRTVLVVDDHADIRSLIREYLQAGNFQVICAEDGRQALKLLQKEMVELVILDLNMPGCDGFEVCRRIRESSSIPVLVVSARSEDLDKILALELGADDYISKPFNPRELVARVQATFRRIDWDRSGSTGERACFGPLKMDLRTHQAWVYDRTLALTPIEGSLLAALIRHSGQNLSRQRLLDEVWGPEYAGDERTVDAHIRSVRQKLRQAEATLRPIRSVWGVGYRFEG